MRQLLKPARLRPGHTIGIISPSWGGLGAFPERTARGLRQLEAMGFRVRVAANARGGRGHVSGTAAERVADLHELFADPEVRGIVAAIGGDHACQLLPLLDFDLIRANPKVFVGFSDITVLNLALHTATGLVTFDGPALLSDFAEFPDMDPYTRDGFSRVVCQPEPAGLVSPAAAWTDEFLDWSLPEERQRARVMRPSPGWS